MPILLLPTSGAGCVGTIYVPQGTPVRLRETIHAAKVWVKDANGKPGAVIGQNCCDGPLGISFSSGSEGGGWTIVSCCFFQAIRDQFFLWQ